MRGIVIGISICAAVILAFLFLVPPAPKTEVPAPVQPRISLNLYFATPDAAGLQLEQREVPATREPSRLAMDELLRGSQTGLTSPIPAGTKLRGLAIRDRVAYVDLSDDVLKTPNRGSASEMLIVSSIVNTLTEFTSIEKVQILIEGKELETLYGHLDLSEPIARFR